MAGPAAADAPPAVAAAASAPRDVGDGLSAWFGALLSWQSLAELGVIAGCVGGASAIAARLRARFGPTEALPGRGHVLFGERTVDGALFPALALLLAVVAQVAWRLQQLPTTLFRVAIPLLFALLVIRASVRVLHAVFPSSRTVRLIERTGSWLVWLGLVLWLTGLLPVVQGELEAFAWTIGGARVTLRSLVEGAMSVAAVLVGVLWLSSAIETRLMGAQHLNVSARKMAANATRALLLIVGVLVAMSVAGIPLGALGVLGGAVGVGIGLGLQKLASNYVSGFVVLAERSLRIGDHVRVDGFEGRITDITMRYTVIRSPTGREAIVPNEMLVTQRIENLSLADPRIALTTTFQVAYGTDLDALRDPLLAAVRDVARVLPEPPPSLQLSAFAADGLELTLVYWVADLENGQGNVRSDVNLALLKALEAHGAEIPFPQREVRVRGALAPENLGSSNSVRE